MDSGAIFRVGIRFCMGISPTESTECLILDVRPFGVSEIGRSSSDGHSLVAKGFWSAGSQPVAAAFALSARGYCISGLFGSDEASFRLLPAGSNRAFEFCAAGCSEGMATYLGACEISSCFHASQCTLWSCASFALASVAHLG